MNLYPEQPNIFFELIRESYRIVCENYNRLEYLRIFTRLAEVADPISDVQLRTSNDGTIEVTYRDSRGYLGRHILPRTEIRYGPSGKPVVL